MTRIELLVFDGCPSWRRGRVDGVDLEGYDGPGVLACRRYGENDGRGWPSRNLLRDRLRAAAPAASVGRRTDADGSPT